MAQHLESKSLIGSLKAELPDATIRRMEELNVPGAAIVCLEDFSIQCQWNLGIVACNQPDQSVSEKTLFQAASISKFATAVVVLQLVEQGVFDLDVDINFYLRSWQYPESELTRKTPITLRLLLSHLSGIPSTSFETDSSGSTPTLLDVIEGRAPALNTPAVPLSEVGNSWEYSNLGYVLMQLVLEDTLQESFEEICQSRLFDPLGMKHSTFDYNKLKSLPETEEALPHDSNGTVQKPDLDSPAKAQGGLMTTAHDLAVLLKEVMLASKGASTLLSSDLFSLLTEEQVNLPFKILNQDTRMGLGILLLGDPEHGAIFHNGYNSPGTGGAVIAWPEVGNGLVVLANGANAELLYTELITNLGMWAY